MEFQMETRESVLSRLERFMLAFQFMPPDGDIDIMGGVSQRGEKCLVIKIADEMYPFLDSELDVIEHVFESTIKECGQIAREEGLPNLLKGIRDARRLRPQHTPARET